ncbi:MAG: redox-regulated ATPase YchF [Synergistales bacterium]|nr:redox-regulated ATPase YchF [Synergistales bacterium]MDY6401255.1 redox-regulated ATPase YchF [Synergistales bacterium]MDY6404405.1 redox-regulated ATPase YchF [Synergistales bacterium]MDY6410236.1 redox-regulated ATPase YchF [Synergistales bacterium]MDY6414389.1 redox-regulated ATPase YchF [Synergistales bacterium]
MLKCGIVGLPLSGKSTVFNVITRAGAEVKPYAGGKTEPNRALVSVPDKRFDKLVEIFKPKSEKPADVEFVDLAGLSRNAGKGAGLGNSFLSFVSESEALLHVIRVFKNSSVPHPENSIDPLRDWRIVEAELIYRDLGVISNRLTKLEEKQAKKKLTPQESSELELIKELETQLLNERPLRELNLTDEQKRILSGFAFLTLKPELIVLNLDDTQTGDVPELKELESEMAQKGLKSVKVYGATEMELEQLDPEDRAEFMKDLSITEPGRDRLIHEAYKLLGLISFFTSGTDEVRAWTLREGSNAVDAAGTIHSDLARGFIRAQVVAYDDFIANNASMAQCREKGVLRLEGKEYIVKDGDMIEIRFNV